MEAKMKLFVWREPETHRLLAVAMAPDIKTAKQAILNAGYPEFYFVNYGIKGEFDVVQPVVYENATGVTHVDFS